ncbi:membrane-spanning 4-domains subfamily A member 18 [Echinops telfairi]|uniref:Membrane-spanning 4-domains subfamily A member 18 n=1 Tax=Echinops telfairi TaxID=9371 RepID=A0AC55DML6_ECHTE|nr:membrane-spanning 4-domains subfamily A member 18 [Echinops telfairi]
MTTLKIGTNSVPGVIASVDVHTTKPRYPVAAGSPGQTTGVITYPASSSMVQGTSNPFQWNMSFGTFSTFDPKEFINEEVRTLGAIQILIGLMHIFLGINPLLYPKGLIMCVTGASGYLFWGGMSFITSGSLSVHAAKDPSPCMVNGSVGMNVVSAIFSLCGMCILITEMALNPEIYLVVYSGSLLPFALLEFCLTCVVSHFGCQATCWNRFKNMTSISTRFKANPIGTTHGPYNATHSANSATHGPYNATHSANSVTNGPYNATNSANSVINGPYNATHSANSATNGPYNVTHSANSVTNGPYNATNSSVNPAASHGTNYVNVATSPVNTTVGVVHATTDPVTHAYPNTTPQEVPSSIP